MLRQTHVATAHDIDLLGNQLKDNQSTLVQHFSENTRMLRTVLQDVLSGKALEKNERPEEKKKERELEADKENADTNTKQISILQQELAEKQKVIVKHEGEKTVAQKQQIKDQSRIQELQQELVSAQGEKETYLKQHMAHLSKINDHEKRIEEFQLGEAKHEKQHSSNKSRIVELEKSLSHEQAAHAAAHAANARQSALSRTREAELERQLTDLQSVHDSHVRQNDMYRTRCIEAERELAEVKEDTTKQILSLTKQVRDAEASKAEIAEINFHLEQRLNVKSVSMSPTSPAEIFRKMQGDGKFNQDVQALQSRCANLESLNKVAQAQHQVLWGYMPKEAESAVEQKLRAMKTASRY
jgi:chromosome segregation ATPase